MKSAAFYAAANSIWERPGDFDARRNGDPRITGEGHGPVLKVADVLRPCGVSAHVVIGNCTEPLGANEMIYSRARDALRIDDEEAGRLFLPEWPAEWFAIVELPRPPGTGRERNGVEYFEPNAKDAVRVLKEMGFQHRVEIRPMSDDGTAGPPAPGTNQNRGHQPPAPKEKQKR